MNRLTSILLTFVVCVIAAGAATSIAMSHNAYKKTTQVYLTPKTSPTHTPTPTPSATAAPTHTLVATPISTPTAKRTAITNDLVHLRADKSTSSAILTDLQRGTTVILGSDETPQWQSVNYGSYSGYVWKTYLIY